jgi:SAM-dependent methyltransferase
MNPEEYAVMDRVAERHWWYRGLRDALERCLTSSRLALPARPRILDAGCGTGENLRLFQDRLSPAYLAGFDASELAVPIARRKAPLARIYQSDVCDPEIEAGDLDLVTSLDVIYIPGAVRAMPGLRRLVEQIRPGGLLLLNLPAFDWLYSEHDVAIHTSQRFTAGEVRALFDELGLTVELMTYRLCFLFPALVGSRLAHKPRAREGAGDTSAARSDLQRPPGAFTNEALFNVVRAENVLIAQGVSFPFGGSVFGVARKPR